MRAFILCRQPALATLLESHLAALGVPTSVHEKANAVVLDPARPTPAIAIVDWPGSFEALREDCRCLRAGPGGQTLLILALAPNLTPTAECQALECGCDDVLGKPLDVRLLVLRLKRLLDQATRRFSRGLAEQALAGREAAEPAGTAPQPEVFGTLLPALIHGSKDAILVMRAVRAPSGEVVDFMFDEVNGPAERMMDLSRALLIGRKATESIPEIRAKPLFHQILQAIQRGESLEGEMPLDPNAPRHRWFRYQIVPNPEGAILLARDITQPKTMERDLQRVSEQLRTLMDAIPLGLFMKDKQGRSLAVNQTMADWMGTPLDALLGRTAAGIDTGTPHPQSQIDATDREVLETGRTLEFELRRAPHPDGSGEYLHVLKRPIRNAQGRIAGLVGFAQDISARKRKDEELERSKALLQAVFDAIPHAVFVKDPEDRYVTVNRAMERLQGPGSGSVIGKSLVMGELRDRHDFELSGTTTREVMKGADRVDFCQVLDLPHLGRREFITIKVPLRDERGRVTGVVGVSEDITERVRAERERRSGEVLLQAVFDAIPQFVFVKDRNGRYIKINRAMEREWMGERCPIGRHTLFEEGRPADEVALARESDRRALAGEERVSEIGRVTMPDGSVMEYSSVKVPLRDSGGRVTGLAGIAEDITERRKAAAALQENRLLLQTILDTLPETVYVKDREGRYTLVNHVMCVRHNLGREQLLGKTVEALRFANSDGIVAVQDADRRVLAQGEVVELPELRLEFQDGRVVYERHLKAPLRDGSGQIAGIVGIAEDITSRVLSDEALKSNQRLLRTILDTLPEGVFVKDLAGRYQLVNRRHAELHGVPPENFLGRHSAEIGGTMTPARLAMVQESDRQVLQEGKIVDLTDVPYRSAAGEEAWERLVKVPLRDERGRIVGLVGLREDITARKKAEDERLALERLMQRTQNLESLGAMAGNIAHDFNNLLQRILGYAELAMLEADAGCPAMSSVQLIHDAGTSAVQLTKQMLNLSGRTRLALEAVDLDALAETGAAQLRRTLAPGLELNLVHGSGTPPVMGDAALLRQVLDSLVSNSAEAMAGTAGQITLTTGALTLERGRLDDSFSDWDVELGRYGFLEVRDTGPGISDEMRARLFEPFVSTKFTGRGLGLAAVRGIVRGHRGTIQALSSQGAGATFRVLLPAADPRSFPPT